MRQRTSAFQFVLLGKYTQKPPLSQGVPLVIFFNFWQSPGSGPFFGSHVLRWPLRIGRKHGPDPVALGLCKLFGGLAISRMFCFNAAIFPPQADQKNGSRRGRRPATDAGERSAWRFV